MTKAAIVYEGAPAAYLSQFNRIGAGPVAVKSARITADGIVYTGACIFYGLKVLVAGTSIDVHDALSAVASSEVIDGDATTTLGAVLTPAGAGVGVLMNTGIYANIDGGQYMFFYAPAV